MFETGLGAYGAIGGALPWGGTGQQAGSMFASLGQEPAAAGAALSRAYESAYNTALAQNQSNYNNILAGYQATLAAQTTAQQAIGAGYSNLYNEVQRRLAGQGATRAADISAAATADLGQQTQSLIGRGLGNTTVANAIQRANQFDRQRQLTANTEAIAALQANASRDIGGAGLRFQQDAANANTALQARQLDWMNSINAPYPTAALYAQLAAQAGQTQQQRANAAQLASIQRAPVPQSMAPAYGMPSVPGPRLGYVPAPTPTFGGAGYQAIGGGGYGSSMFSGYGGTQPSYAQVPQPFDFGAAGSAITGGGSSVLYGYDKASPFADNAQTDAYNAILGGASAYAGGASTLPSDWGQYWDDYNNG